jgi:regulator of protease activity HflC (stomatin/prohibitin superfamily)
VLLFALLLVGMTNVVQPWEIGLVYSGGTVSRKLDPGTSLVAPLFSQVKKVDLRTRTLEMRLPLDIGGQPRETRVIIYYKVSDPEKAAAAGDVELKVYEAARKVVPGMRFAGPEGKPE